MAKTSHVSTTAYQRWLLRPGWCWAAFVAVSLSLIFGHSHGLGGVSAGDKGTQPSNRDGNGGYVGSKACASCHRQIYEEYSQTDMGRSISVATPSFFEKIPTSTRVFDPRSNRYFEVFGKGGDFFQSEYEVGADGKDLFRDTHKMEWIIGAGAIGFGAMVKRGDSLFEAPLSFYSQPGAWELSPGYEFNDYGFARAILPNCIACHSGRPQPLPNGNGRFGEPPFSELAIGCENCHGPGAGHALERLQEIAAPDLSDRSIVNPAKLPSWLADNICMFCHQTGDVRVLQAGKSFQDFRPGTPLDDTLAIFMVPLKRDSPPPSDLLQHYFSMTLSKCYRASRGELRCISCHDPHVEPREQQIPDYYRKKCLACHTEKSCAVPLTIRQHKDPPDHCAGCHLPKREVRVISHAALTNHRIIAQTEEPYPETAFHLTTPRLPDLIHLSQVPGQEQRGLRPLTLLQAYAQLTTSHPEFSERYVALAKQMETSEAKNVPAFEALAHAALGEKHGVGTGAAIQYLRRAVEAGATSPEDYEQLATLLTRASRLEEAADVLQRGLEQAPYDAELYRLLAENYRARNKPEQACGALAHAVDVFPQDSVARTLLQRCGIVSSKH